MEDYYSESAKTRMIHAGGRIGEENDSSQDNCSGESADMLRVINKQIGDEERRRKERNTMKVVGSKHRF